MKTRNGFALCLLALPLAGGVAGAQSNFYLKDGDRVVFYGDSITDQRLYTTFAETYVVTRFPKMNVTFVHSGWGGDRVTGGGGGPIDLRLKRDVFAWKPTVVTVMLGMNDGNYRAYDDGTFNTFATGYQHIVTAIKSAFPTVRMTLIEPSPYDDVTRAPNFEGGYNAVLVRYGNYLKELAQKENLQTADLNTPVVAALEKAKTLDTPPPAKPGDPTLPQRLLPDRVHPGPGGHLLMAEALLKAWNAPALVSRVEINVASASASAQSENGRVSQVDWKEGVLGWTEIDNALPMPMDTNDAPLALAVRASDVVEALDQQPLKVTGLSAARYALAIDGKPIGDFTKEQLADGINLATLPTPMLKQAFEVHDFTRMHNDLHFTRWRVIQVPHQDALDTFYVKTLAALDRAEDEIVKQQERAAAQPKPHRFELKPR